MHHLILPDRRHFDPKLTVGQCFRPLMNISTNCRRFCCISSRCSFFGKLVFLGPIALTLTACNASKRRSTISRGLSTCFIRPLSASSIIAFPSTSISARDMGRKGATGARLDRFGTVANKLIGELMGRYCTGKPVCLLPLAKKTA